MHKKHGLADLKVIPRIPTARKYADELAVLYAEHGSIDPEIVVEWAREHPESALHGRFIWDDTKAAHQYRLVQARNIITEVEIVHSDGKVRQVYVSPYDQRKKGGYVALVDVMSDQEKRQRFLVQALLEYQRLGEKYASLQELAEVRAVVARVHGGLKKKKSQKKAA